VESVTKLNFFNSENVNLLDTLYRSRNQAKSIEEISSTKILKESQIKSASKLTIAKESIDPERKKKCFNSADRMENIAIELELESKRKKIEEKISNKNSERQDIIRELGEIDANLDEIKLRIQVLDNYQQYFDMNQRFKKTYEKEVQDKKMKNIDSDRLVKLRHNFRVNS
jgi:hypothetical protein